jgi:hypothetical protein
MAAGIGRGPARRTTGGRPRVQGTRYRDFVWIFFSLRKGQAPHGETPPALYSPRAAFSSPAMSILIISSIACMTRPDLA